MTVRRNLRTLALALATASAPLAGHADKADDTLRFIFVRDLDNPDVYYSTARESVLFGFAVFDTLIYRDPETNEFVGNLASDFEWIDDLTLEFRLREGVTFQNGEPFDADDVIYTFETMMQPEPLALNRQTLGWIDRVEKIDQYTVRLHANAPTPVALEYLAMSVPIYPNEYYAELGSSRFAASPVGTGPYKVDAIDPGRGFTLSANDTYFDGPKSKPSISKVEVRTIPDVNTQIAELLSSTADFLWQVPEDQARQLARRDELSVINAPTMRIGYLTMDATGRAGVDGPFTDVRVRQAMAHAIDRQAIVSALMSESNQVIESVCYPSQFGCEQDVTTYGYDPEKAKALLAEAGYPNGFTTKLIAYRDRPLTEAMMGMLAEVGIKADLTYLQYAAATDAITKGESPFAFMTWGSSSIGDTAASASRFFTGGGWDDARDPEVIAALKEGDTSVDPEVRRAAYSTALKRIANEAYWVPLWTYSTNYVMNDDIDYSPTPDEIVRFYEIRWK